MLVPERDHRAPKTSRTPRSHAHMLSGAAGDGVGGVVVGGSSRTQDPDTRTLPRQIDPKVAPRVAGSANGHRAAYEIEQQRLSLHEKVSLTLTA